MSSFFRRFVRVHDFFGANASDIVIDRQLRELKQQLPRVLIGIAITSALVGYRFYDQASTVINISLGLFLVFIAFRVPTWTRLKIDEMCADAKRRLARQIPIIAGCLGGGAVAIGIFMTQYADKEGHIMLALWCLYCGVASSMGLSAVPLPAAAVVTAVVGTAAGCVLRPRTQAASLGLS